MDKRRLNELLAEHVMGWRKVYDERLEAWGWHDEATGDFHFHPSELPDFVGTWEGMGLVVEAMKEKHDALFALTNKYNHSPERNRVECGAWFTILSTRREGIGYDDEAPIAAGIAALNALGVEMP